MGVMLIGGHWSSTVDEEQRATRRKGVRRYAVGRLKRSMDLVLGGCLLVLLLPGMLLAALLIKLDSNGPALFVQKRYGLMCEPFDILKFLTMYHHLSDPLGVRQLSAHEDRVTRVGRWLRGS